MDWTVVVNAAPSRVESGLFAQTFSSIRLAGWTDCQWCVNVESWTLDTAWPRWRQSILNALSRSDSSHFLVVQDDVILSRGLREWLEHVSWNGISVYSLYTPGSFPIKDSGWHKTSRGAWGACAYAMNRMSLSRVSFFDSDERAIDAQISVSCNANQIPYWTHVPSLVQHVGVQSILHPGSPLDDHRTAATAVNI